jgi:hypothetical protein
MSLILILLGIYLIGMFFAAMVAKASVALWKKCEKSFVEDKTTAGIMGFLLFPISSMNGAVGVQEYHVPIGISMIRQDPKKFDIYIGITMLLWPAKLVLSIISMLIYITCSVLSIGLNVFLYFARWLGNTAKP